MKQTALSSTHEALGAKMAEFAGYNMPIIYTSIKEEHQQVRTNVGVFDVSHMGEFIVRGKEALDLIQKVTSNDVSKLEIGDAQYSCLPNHEGGIVDDLLVYRLDEDKCADGERSYMLVVNASNIEKDWNWISQQNDFDAIMYNISERTGLLAVQGPNAAKLLQPLTDIDLSAMKYYTFAKGEMAGIDDVLISVTGYTGSGGFELYVRNEQLPVLWKAIFKTGKDMDVKPIGLGARDTLRLEMGFCLYGNDIDDATSPIEAGLGWITKTKKGEFNSRDIFVKQREEGVTKKLVAFTVDDRRVPRQGYKILNEAGEEIGVVTSGTQSPSLDIPIGLGYVDVAYAKREVTIKVVAGKKHLEATIVKLPFYKG
ncbi:MAG: glycine cleavage system aminomethyltransferase GcvT [Saprospiraceae bacterium]